MKTRDRARFDIDTLWDLAGEAVFARGEAYHRGGRVQILALEPERVLAQVSGTEDYRSVLTGRGRKIDGECSCPAFEDWGFCKHLVATALAANAAGDDAEAEGAGALARIRAHLKGLGIDKLVAMIVDLAERDPALFRKLDLAAAAVDPDDRKIEARLGRAIDGATRTGEFIHYGAAADWAAGVGAALDAVENLAGGKHAGLALKLAERAIDRIGRAIESIDDSDGHCGGLLEHAQAIHLAAAEAARPDPVRLARDLFARETADQFNTFAGAAARYAEVLGAAGLAEYRQLATAAWEKLPRCGSRQRYEAGDNHRRLADILDFFAERDGDVEARIALRAKHLASPSDYVQLAEFCRAHGRDQDALRHAEEGLWVFEDERPDERLVALAVELLSKAGRSADAEAHLWRAFERVPSLELYRRLRKLGGAAARDRALTFLEAALAGEKRSGWHDPADLLIRALMHEKRFDAAWASLRKHRASPDLAESLARASETTHPAEALVVYAARVEQLANLGGNHGYAEAASLIARMAGLRGVAEQAAYVAALKTRFGRRRNFLKLLA